MAQDSVFTIRERGRHRDQVGQGTRHCRNSFQVGSNQRAVSQGRAGSLRPDTFYLILSTLYTGWYQYIVKSWDSRISIFGKPIIISHSSEVPVILPAALSKLNRRLPNL